jgi:glycosyltransferase involved in cell wall biosynthesis
MIVFNHGAYIRAAMESVLMQETDFEFELVISNDCSVDDTNSIIQEYIFNHPKAKNIKYFNRKENIGMMQNFIFTLQHCTGKYIAMCEGDDYWTDTLKLQKQVSALENDNVFSMVITNRKVLNSNNEWFDESYEKEYRKNIFCTADIVNGFVPGMQTILMRNYSSLVDYFLAHPEFYYGDRYLAYYCSLFGNILLIPEYTAVYRMTGAGMWTVNTPIQKLHAYTQFMQNFHKSLGIPDNNEVLAMLGINTSYTTLKYGIRRPSFLLKKDFIKIIIKPWLDYPKMNKFKLLLSLVFNRKRN